MRASQLKLGDRVIWRYGSVYGAGEIVSANAKQIIMRDKRGHRTTCRAYGYGSWLFMPNDEVLKKIEGAIERKKAIEQEIQDYWVQLDEVVFS